jgi:hypothetical protein
LRRYRKVLKMSRLQTQGFADKGSMTAISYFCFQLIIAGRKTAGGETLPGFDIRQKWMHRHSVRDNCNVPLARSRLCKIERRIPGNKRGVVSALFPRKLAGS